MKIALPDVAVRWSVLFAALAALVGPLLPAQAQPCGVQPGFAPGLTFNTSLASINTTALTVYNDGSGPALYVVGTPGFFYGYLGSPDVLSCVGRLRAGRFERVGYSTTGEADAVVSADLGANFPGGPRLYVGGRTFRASNADGTSAGPIAMWDGARWQAIPNTPAQMVVLALQAFDDGQGGGTQLYAAGSFNFSGSTSLVARWNGSVWQPLPLPAPGGSNTTGFDLSVIDDGTGPALYLAGTFSATQQDGGGGLAKWTGSGWALIPSPASNSILTSVEGFAGPQGPTLYVGGPFYFPNLTSSGVARRNPDGSWSTIGVNTTFSSLQTVRLSVLDEPSGPVLYIGGASIAGGTTAGGYIRFDGVNAIASTRTYTSFNGFTGSGLGSTGPAALFDAGFGPEVWIGGAFGAFSDAASATPVVSPAHSLLRAPLSDGPTATAREAGRGVNLSLLSGSGNRPVALSLRFQGRDQLGFFGPVLGGGGLAGGSYALFDGASWQTFTRQSTFRFTAGVGTPDSTSEPLLLLAANNGPVGYFSSTGNQFNPYGGGTNNFSDARAMLYFDEGNPAGPALFVQDISSVKRLVPGSTSQWQTVITGVIRAMIIADLGQGPRLLVSGNVNSGAPGVAMWNGVAFQPFGPVATFPSPITSMVVHDDGNGPNLYIGFEGTASLPGQAPASRIARLRNNVWEPLGMGLIGNTNLRLSLASFDDGSGPALYAAGDFTRAGNGPSRGFARWRAGVWEPVLDINTRSGTGTPLQELSLAVLGDTLYLHGYFADTGLSLPGTQTVTDANVVIGENLIAIKHCPPGCFPDVDRDGAIDQGDVDYLINAAAGGDNPTGANLDLNNDGVVDQGDVDRLIDVVAGGPCQ